MYEMWLNVQISLKQKNKFSDLKDEEGVVVFERGEFVHEGGGFGFEVGGVSRNSELDVKEESSQM